MNREKTKQRCTCKKKKNILLAAPIRIIDEFYDPVNFNTSNTWEYLADAGEFQPDCNAVASDSHFTLGAETVPIYPESNAPDLSLKRPVFPQDCGVVTQKGTFNY